MIGLSDLMLQVLFCIQIVWSFPAIPVGFSYTKFSGPVSGPEKEIVIYDPQDYGHPHVDYIAKPDYQFSYGVDDPLSKVLQSRKERRYGDVVQGEYSVVEPSGLVRVVKYVADDVHGFQAEVVTEGHPNLQVHHHVPAVIPVHEVYDDPVTSAPSPSTHNQESSRESAVVHEQEQEQNDSTYSAERSGEDEESYGQHHALDDDDDEDSSGSDESEDSSY